MANPPGLRVGRGELCPFPQDDDDDGEGFAFLVLKSERRNKKRRKNLGFGASTWGEPGGSGIRWPGGSRKLGVRKVSGPFWEVKMWIDVRIFAQGVDPGV